MGPRSSHELAVGGLVLLSIWVAHGGMQQASGARIEDPAQALILSHFRAGCDRARALDHLRGDRFEPAGLDRVRDPPGRRRPRLVDVRDLVAPAATSGRCAGRRSGNAGGAALPGGGRRGPRDSRCDDGRARVPGHDRRGQLDADVERLRPEGRSRSDRVGAAGAARGRGSPWTPRARLASTTGSSPTSSAADRTAGSTSQMRSRWRWMVPRHAKVCSTRPELGAECEIVQPELLGELSTERRLDILAVVDAAYGRRPPHLTLVVAELDEQCAALSARAPGTTIRSTGSSL